MMRDFVIGFDEMEILDSIERKEIFDLHELDILEGIPVTSMGTGFHIIDSLEDYNNEF